MIISLLMSQIFISLSVPVAVYSLKDFKMKVLHMIPFTGAEPKNGQTCRAASQIVVDLVNKRSDILPDYFVEMQYEDEAAGINAAQIVTAYGQQYLESTFANGSTILSPLILGPSYSTGCKAVGRFLHYLDLVDISSFCTAPILTNRILFPNLYLMASTGEITAISELLLIQQIGKWKRFALISNAANVNDYSTAMIIHKLALEQEIDVPVFDIVLEIREETLKQIINNDLRIVVLFTSTPYQADQFLCETYRQGITGRQYVFIINLSTYIDPYNGYGFYAGCSREMIIEQFKSVIWIGQAMASEDSTIKSDLGQTRADFELMLDFRMNGKRTADYDLRFICYDVVLRGLQAL